jgi:hypothetical protein
VFKGFVGTFSLQWIIALAPFGGMRNDFQKEDCQGENPFAKGAPRTASNAFVQALS